MLADGRNPPALIGAGVSFSVRAEHLYVHVPFCARRCVYCDFSIAVRARVPVDDYVRAVRSELAGRHANSRLELETAYFGGGTPSKLGADGVARLLDTIRLNATLGPATEITLEANPEDVTLAAVAEWRRSGVNRVSLGVQSFDDTVLKWMHRTHDADTARKAVHVLREGGIVNISIDLIFAIPSSVSRTWDRDLDQALSLELPHLSVYGLTVEAQTPLGRWVARHDVAEAPEDAFEREFLVAHDRLTGAGLEHYEVSNYGAPGAHSRHNWAYWNRKPYVGIGPSSHEFDGRTRRWNVAPYAEWASRACGGVDPQEGSEDLRTDQAIAEEVYLNLRTNQGLPVSQTEHQHVVSWIDAGWAAVDRDSRLRLTDRGWLRLDSLANDLTLFRNR